MPAISTKLKKANFYLCSLDCTNPAQWFSEQVVGINTLKKVVSKMLNNVKDGYFTNHSLSRTGATWLSQARVDCKLVKEVTGHASDALDQYQITSNEQREMISKVIECPVLEDNVFKEKVDNSNDSMGNENITETAPPTNSCHVTLNNKARSMGCSYSKMNVNLHQPEKIGSMISQLMQDRRYVNAKIKIGKKLNMIAIVQKTQVVIKFLWCCVYAV